MIIQTDKSILQPADLLALYNAVGFNENGLRDENTALNIIQRADFAAFIYQEKRLIAFGRINYDGFIAEVKDIMTHPDFRKQGHASQILKSIIDYARQNYSCLKLVDGGSLSGFYQKFGFSEPNDEKVHYLSLKSKLSSTIERNKHHEQNSPSLVPPRFTSD